MTLAELLDADWEPTHCTECEDPIEHKWQSNPGPGREDALCDECYDDLTTRCVFCDERFFDEEQEHQQYIAVIGDRMHVWLGHPEFAERGIYRVTGRFLVSDVIGYDYLDLDGLQRVADLPPRVYDTYYQAGDLCPYCAEPYRPYRERAVNWLRRLRRLYWPDREEGDDQ